MARTRKNNQAIIETLEGRTLMTAVALGVSEVAFNGGTQLRITGTSGNDQITVKQTSAGLVIGNTGGFTQTITDTINNLYINGGNGNNSIVLDASVKIDATIIGGGTNDTLVAGGGNNMLFGGSGKNFLQSRTGNDTLVTLGSTADTIIGGAGNDSFWIDNSTAEKIQNLTAAEANTGAVHRVASFYNGGSITVAGKAAAAAKSKVVGGVGIKEPGVDSGVSYTSFANDPIFSSAGPAENDIFQGNVGDCYYLSVLSSVAKIDPTRIRQSVLDMQDGTVVVQLYKNDKPVYVRETENLPTNGNGTLAYAGLGADNSTWVGLMEKAFCYTRTNRVSYAAIDSGWMNEAYAAIGCPNAVSTYSSTGAAALMSLISRDLNAGQSVTYATATSPEGSGLIADHAYTVDHVNADSHGTITGVTLRNPWGCNADGTGNGYITISANTALKAMTGICAVKV